jgi:hypothetical protein
MQFLFRAQFVSQVSAVVPVPAVQRPELMPGAFWLLLSHRVSGIPPVPTIYAPVSVSMLAPRAVCSISIISGHKCI